MEKRKRQRQKKKESKEKDRGPNPHVIYLLRLVGWWIGLLGAPFPLPLEYLWGSEGPFDDHWLRWRASSCRWTSYCREQGGEYVGMVGGRGGVIVGNGLKHSLMHGQSVEWTNDLFIEIEKWAKVWTNERTSELMNGQMNEWTNECTKCIVRVYERKELCCFFQHFTALA